MLQQKPRTRNVLGGGEKVGFTLLCILVWCGTVCAQGQPARHTSELSSTTPHQLAPDDTNLNHNSSYAVRNLRLGYDLQLGPGKISPFIGFNNLGDERYNGLVRLNAVGRRFYEPSPDFNVYGGLAIAYEF